MALAAWALGGLALVAPRLWEPVTHAMALAGDRFGPRRIYAETLGMLGRISDAVHRLEVRDLRNSIAAVLVPGGMLAALGFAFTPTAGAYDVGAVSGEDLLILPLLALVATAALATASAQVHLRMAIALSVVGFGLAAIYAFLSAPNVALVAVLVETVITLVFLAVAARLPSSVDSARMIPVKNLRRRRSRDRIVGVISGVAVFAIVWGFLSRPPVAPGVVEEEIRLAPEAHGKNVVTVILADFRGLDTLAEITVVVIAVVGVAALLHRGRLW
jgi:multicomponent Na+:H+ antiporter subunit A